MTFLIVLGQYPRALIAIVFRLLILMTKCVIITFLGYKSVDFVHKHRFGDQDAPFARNQALVCCVVWVAVQGSYSILSKRS